MSSYNLKNRKSISLKLINGNTHGLKKTLHPLSHFSHLIHQIGEWKIYIYDPIIDKTVIYIQMHVKIIQIATCLLEIHKQDIPYSFTSRQLSIKNISFTVSWKDIDLQFLKKNVINLYEMYTLIEMNTTHISDWTLECLTKKKSLALNLSQVILNYIEIGQLT